MQPKTDLRTRQSRRFVRIGRYQRHAHAEDGQYGEGVDGADRPENGPVGLYKVTKMSFGFGFVTIVSGNLAGIVKKFTDFPSVLPGTQSAIHQRQSFY